MSRIPLRVSASRSLQALAVISPATIAKPVLTIVSQATRARLPWARLASRTASEIWSALLSGGPSATDTEAQRGLAIGFDRTSGWSGTRVSVRVALGGP